MLWFLVLSCQTQVRRSGALADVTTLWDLAGTDMVSGSLDDILASRPGFDRLPSINAFDKVLYAQVFKAKFIHGNTCTC